MAVPTIRDPDLPLSEMMTHWPGTIPVFMRHRMICVGCYISGFHTVKDACRLYDLDEHSFRAELDHAVSVSCPAESD